MSPFHNPYHFVPVKKRDEKTCANDLEVTNAIDGQWGHHGHDRYAGETYSGRLVCKLTTETPVFVGGKQIADIEPKEVRQFEMEGEPAIPGSSLRGLLSSIAEAASNSALRVLHRDRPLSYRKVIEDYISALGMVVEDDGQLKVRPLVMPTLKGDKMSGYKLPPGYREIFSNPKFKNAPLKVYLNAYRYDKQAKKFNRSGFLATNPKSYVGSRPEFVYMNLGRQDDFKISNGALAFNATLKTKPTKQQENVFCLGQLPNSDEVLKSPKEGFVRGILYVLGIDGRSDMIETKKHEIFIPYPEWMEEVPLLTIHSSVISKFETLSDERTEDSVDDNGNKRKDRDLYPYSPVGTQRNNNNAKLGQKLRLKAGDIVYFAPTMDGTEVAELSFSSIWRGYAGTIEDYFRKVDPELLPFNKTRTRITPAELLFGFVQDEKEKDAKSLAFKGKVRVSCGRLVDGQNDFYEPGDVTLKILSSPKPPSPALYFKPAGEEKGRYISKADLSDPRKNAIPQGRKMYLHHRLTQGQQPWKTADEEKNKNQKNRIKPLRKELEFMFYIDFNNLNKWELGLLCYAVRPMEGFRHKIGMGKPLGLGTVRIDPVELSTVDRQNRYSLAGFKSTRFRTDGVSFDDMRKVFTTGMDGDIKNALRLLGAPKFVTAPVHTPQIDGLDVETDTYKWFGANDNRGLNDDQREFLEPLRDGLNELKTLDTPPTPDERGGYRPQGGQRHDNPRNNGNKPGGGNRGNFRR